MKKLNNKTNKIYFLLLLFFIVNINLYSTEKNDYPFENKIIFDGVTPVEKYKELQVKGSNLCDYQGNPIQLKGISSSGLQWYGQFINEKSIQWLRDYWGINVFRLAMYTAEGGYIDNPNIKKDLINGVNLCLKLGLYVIIDWHILSDGNPNRYKKQSKDFFIQMAKLFADKPNVIYEICNEPNGNTVVWNNNTDNDIKSYAEYIIPEIRQIDPDNIIIIGSARWSQDITDPADDPLTNNTNIMYSCHFYAGTHTQWLRDRISYCMDKGIAVFVTEWGTSQATGTGGVFLEESRAWVLFMKKNKISWCNWSLCDKGETSALLLPGAGTGGSWDKDKVSLSGKFVKESINE